MPTCYTKHSSLISHINSGLCAHTGSAAGFYSCCFPWDLCLPGGLCMTPNGYPTYYTALCTDPEFKDDACRQSCTDLAYPYVLYNDTLSAWQCCGADASRQKTCLNTSVETFDAPAPVSLLASTLPILDSFPTSVMYSTATSSSSTATSAPATVTITASPASASAIPQNRTSTLSAGAGVGIGIGATLAAALITLAAWFLLQRSKKRKAADENTKEPQKPEAQSPGRPLSREKETVPPDYTTRATSGVELHNESRAHELGYNGAGRRPQELGA